MAGSSLGTLSIEVLANIANMVSDLGKAQSANAQAARQFQKDWQDSIGAVGDAFNGLIGIIGVGISVDWLKNVATQALDGAEQIDHLSQSLGVSQQTLQTMSFAAGLVGGNLDTATAAMTRLEKSAEQAAAGSQQQVEAFRAIGISGSQLTDLLKNPDQMIQTVAQHISQFGDGAAKTAVVIELMGRGAAQNIPFLNELGKSFDDLKQRAIDFGVVLSSQDQSVLVATKENLNTLKEAGSGLANEFTLALAPAINAVTESLTEMATSGTTKSFFKEMGTDVSEAVVILGQIGGMLSSIGSQFGTIGAVVGTTTGDMTGDLVGFIHNAQDDVDKIVNAFADGWVIIKADAAIVWQDIKNDVGQLGANIETAFGLIAKAASGLLAATGDLFGAAQMDAYGDSLKKLGDDFKPVTADVSQYTAEIQNNDAQLLKSLQSNQQWADGVRATAGAFGELSSGLDFFEKALVKGDISGNLSKLATAEQAVTDKGAELIAQGADRQKVDADTAQVINSMTAAVQRADAANLDYDAKVIKATSSQKQLNTEMAKWMEQNDALAAKANPVNAAMETFDSDMLKASQEIVTMIGNGLSLGDAMALLAQRTDLETQKMWDSIAADVEKNDKADELTQTLLDQVNALGALTTEQKAAADFDKIAAQNLVTLHDVYGQVHDSIEATKQANEDAKQGWVDDTTAILNHIQQLKLDQEVMKEWASIASNAFDSAFTDINKDIIEGGNVMKDLENVAKQVVEAILLQFEKLAIINPILNSIFGVSAGGGSLLPTLENSALGSLFGGSSGGGIMSGLFGNVSRGIGNVIGSASMNTGIMGWLFGDSSASTLGELGGGLSADGAGALGDFSGPGTGLLNYGGEFNVTADATEGVDQGFSAAADYGTTAGTSFLGTVGPMLGAAALGYQVGGVAGAVGLAAAAYFIPVVGWIAGAISLVNMVTGGGLLGTDWKPTGNSEQDISVDSSGATATASVEESKKKALFGGRSWRTLGVPEDQQTTDAINAAFGQVSSVVTAAATALGEDAGTVISGSWAETMDKTGKVLTNISTVGGQQFTDTNQQFFERIAADSEEALLPVSAGLTKFFNQFQSNADQLADAANMLVQAQVDINKGMGLFGTADTDLGDIGNEVQKLAQGSETLIQTYVRLQTEQMDVAQALQEMGMVTNNTGQAFVEFADDMTTAAGGLQNLQTLWSDYYSNYFSGSEQANQALQQAEAASNTALSGIGENIGESMAQFREDFTNAMPNLTGAQVTQWLQAADALTSFNKAVASVASVVRQAEADAASLSQTLFGTDIQQLQAQIAQYASQGLIDPGAADQLAALQAQQGQQQQLGEATQLIEDFGNIGAVTGQSLQDFATKFNVPLDKLATMLGTDMSGLQADFDQQEAAAKTSLEIANNTALTNQLLAAINAQLGGPAIAIPSTGAGTAVIVPNGTPPPSRGQLPVTPPAAQNAVVTAINQNTAQMAQLHSSTVKMHTDIRAMATKQRGTRGTATA